MLLEVSQCPVDVLGGFLSGDVPYVASGMEANSPVRWVGIFKHTRLPEPSPLMVVEAHYQAEQSAVVWSVSLALTRGTWTRRTLERAEADLAAFGREMGRGEEGRVLPCWRLVPESRARKLARVMLDAHTETASRNHLDA